MAAPTTVTIAMLSEAARKSFLVANVAAPADGDVIELCPYAPAAFTVTAVRVKTYADDIDVAFQTQGGTMTFSGTITATDGALADYTPTGVNTVTAGGKLTFSLSNSSGTPAGLVIQVDITYDEAL